MPYHVYALIDPRDDAVVYIGITNKLTNRLKQHVSGLGEGNDKKTAWIRELQSKNLLPVMCILETVASAKEAREYEEAWIQYYLAQQEPLINRLLPVNPPRRQVVIKAFEQVDVAGILAPKYYVYTLAYPDGTVFYVGKGSGNRIERHESDAKHGYIGKTSDVIRQIWASGSQVQKQVLYETSDEEDALAHELHYIKCCHSSYLTNVLKKRHSK